MLACPTPDIWKRIHCIDYYSLCDRKIHCSNGEDEDPIMCLFHSAVSLMTPKFGYFIWCVSSHIHTVKGNWRHFSLADSRIIVFPKRAAGVQYLYGANLLLPWRNSNETS